MGRVLPTHFLVYLLEFMVLSKVYKPAFLDTVVMLPSACPTSCACGHNFTVEHSISYPKGGFPSLRHNEVRDLTANMMSEVCSNASVEPHLQPLSGETLCYQTTNSDHENDFGWGEDLIVLFNVRVFNPHSASSNHPFRKEKRCQYE